jgi:magnesium transporter
MLTSNKMNEIMKVLTMVATVMLPLTVITGIYGIHVSHMPELAWPWGYPMAWFLMCAVTGGMIDYMRRRQWL